MRLACISIQISTVRDFGAVGRVSIVVNDPDATEREWSGLVTACTLCLCTSLVSLRLGLLKMHDATFMLALGERGWGWFT